LISTQKEVLTNVHHFIKVEIISVEEFKLAMLNMSFEITNMEIAELIKLSPSEAVKANTINYNEIIKMLY